jgi:hypothetical protein
MVFMWEINLKEEVKVDRNTVWRLHRTGHTPQRIASRLGENESEVERAIKEIADKRNKVRTYAFGQF